MTKYTGAEPLKQGGCASRESNERSPNALSPASTPLAAAWAPQRGLLDPLLHGLARGRCDLELQRTLRIVLNHRGTGGHVVAVADVPNLEADEVAPAQLAVDSQVEEGELAHPVFHLQANMKRPDVLELERCPLTDGPALVPRLAMSNVGAGSRDSPPSS